MRAQILLRDFRFIFEAWLHNEGELSHGTLSTRDVTAMLRRERIEVRKADKNKTYVFGLRGN